MQSTPATHRWPQVPVYGASRRGPDRLRWGDPVATHVAGWLWVAGRLVRVCDANLPRGRFVDDAYHGESAQ